MCLLSVLIACTSICTTIFPICIWLLSRCTPVPDPRVGHHPAILDYLPEPLRIRRFCFSVQTPVAVSHPPKGPLYNLSPHWVSGPGIYFIHCRRCNCAALLVKLERYQGRIRRVTKWQHARASIFLSCQGKSKNHPNHLLPYLEEEYNLNFNYTPQRQEKDIGLLSPGPEDIRDHRL